MEIDRNCEGCQFGCLFVHFSFQCKMTNRGGIDLMPNIYTFCTAFVFTIDKHTSIKMMMKRQKKMRPMSKFQSSFRIERMKKNCFVSYRKRDD